MDKHITTPITAEVTKNLKSGDYVYITGTIYVARDAAHKRMIEALERGEELPIDIKDSTIYYMQIVFGEITTGASNDIEQATKIARAMITRYGMTDEFDMVAMENVTNQYLGGDTSLSCSADTQKEIDEKVVQLVKAEHEKARKILAENREKLDELAMYLYEKETITGDEFMDILDRK